MPHVPKRLCAIAYTHYLTDARPRREAEALADRGDAVDFVGLWEEGQPKQATVRGVNVIRMHHARYRGDNPIAYIASYLNFFVRVSCWLSLQWLRGHRYDVIHVHTMPDFMVFTTSIMKLLGARVVLDVHDTMPELYRSKFKLSASHPLIQLLILQERLACAFADQIIAVHALHKTLLIERGVPSDKIAVVLNVPDPALFGPAREPHAAPPPPSVVYHGTIAARLGVDLAVEAFTDIAEEIPAARLHIYGTGDAAHEVQIAINASPAYDRITFPNIQFAVDAIPELVQHAWVGIVSNRLDDATKYMLPVKLLEYVHLGIPVVAPRLPAITQHFDAHAIWFYDAGDVRGLAEGMRVLLTDSTRRTTQAQAAYAYAQRYAWPSMRLALFEAIDGTQIKKGTVE